jgi:pyruvate/2-oxoglutarate dehydrogenase complex dihydrolipoamide acyltransferase (E2) component
MNSNIGPYQIVDLSAGRHIWLNTLDLSWTRHAIYALLEVDVTLVRGFISEHKSHNGESLSFTGYITYCLARAVEENKEVQAYLKSRKQVVLMDDVDVGVMIEHKTGEKRALMGHVVRAANRKTYREIHEEIRRAQSEPLPPGRGMPAWFRSALLLPGPLSRLFKTLLAAVVRRDPTILISMQGTVAVTSVGMFGGSHSGWGLTPTGASLGLVVGGIAWKPAVVEGRIEPRQILNLTVVFNHDIVDGAPATRFVRRLVELIESGCGLCEPQV